MTHPTEATASIRDLDWRRIAREEFIIVAKAYFAPIYGTALVIAQLNRQFAGRDRR